MQPLRLTLISMLATVFLSACGSGGPDSVSETPSPQPEPSEPAEPTPVPLPYEVVEFDFTRAADGGAFRSENIQSQAFTNGSGQFKVPISGQSLSGNITVSLDVEDPEGIKAVYIGFSDNNLALQLSSCQSNCATTFSTTISGINPLAFGGTSGEQLLQLWVDDTAGNRSLVDSVSYNWQQTIVSGVSGNRVNNTIELSWNSLTNYLRYNVYVASEPNISSSNYASLADGQAFLALKNTSLTLTGKEDTKTFYTLVTAVDGSGESAFSEEMTFFGLEDAVDLPPTAVNDNFSLNEDNSISDNVLSNDFDTESEVLTVNPVPLTGVSNGTLTLDQQGNFSYTPNANFNGRDGFVYQISDGVGKTDTAVVIFTINQVNDAPIASPNRYNLDIATTSNLASSVLEVAAPGLLRNDVDIDSLNLSIVTEPVSAPTQGTLQLNADGSFIYTANSNASGEDSFVYQTIDDSGALSEQKTVVITFNAQTLAPIATTDHYSLQENQVFVTDNSSPNTLSVLSNDSDGDDPQSLTVSGNIVEQPQNGVLAMNADGTFSYTPTSGYYGVDSFVYTVSDAQGNSAQAGVRLVVNRTNTTPIAVEDNYSLDEDTTFSADSVAGLLRNDFDADFDPISVNTSVLQQPLNGTVAVSADGSFSYTPVANFSGTDSFQYEVLDDSGATASAKVNLTVLNVNDPPVAIEDGASTSENVAVSIAVLDNDSDPEGDSLTIVQASVSANQGSVQIVNNQTLTFTPRANFVGTAQISYTISDGNGGTAQSSVIVLVGAANQAPVANDDSYSATEDEMLIINAASTQPILTANDSDGDGDVLIVVPQPVSNVSHGTLVLSASGNFTYQPNNNFFGTDSFEYQVSDNLGGTDVATVTITVNPVNDSPVAVDDTAQTAEETTMEVNVLANDVDVDGDSLTITSASASHGGVIISETQTLVYTPQQNYFGSDIINYSISDGNGGTDSAQVMMTVVNRNDTPSTTNDNATTLQNVAVTVDVLANDTDIDGDTLVLLDATADSGSVVINANNTLTFTPAQDFLGVATVDYTASDQAGGTAGGLLFVTVISGASPPVATDDTISTNEDTDVQIDVLANDSDADGDTLTIVEATADIGSVSISNNQLLYSPLADFNGTATINYTIADGTGNFDSAKVTVTVIPQNDAPIANNDELITNEDSSGTVNVLANDSDDGNSLRVSAAQAGNGSVVILPDFSLLYTPAADFNGSDIINYTAEDEQGLQAEAMVLVSVLPVNDPPIPQPDNAQIDEDTPLTINVVSNDSDIDSANLTVVAAEAANGTVEIVNSVSLLYQPNTNFNGSDTINYTISDGDGATASSAVSVTIVAINDAPVAQDDIAETNDGVAISIAVLSNDSDIDGDPLTITAASALHGSVVIDGGTTLRYTPNDGFAGDDTISYSIADPQGLSASASVAVKVYQVNDAPVAVDDSATTKEDTLVNINVLANDSDKDGQTLTVTEATATSGTVVIKADNTLDYTPNANFNGADTIVYAISDGALGTASAKVDVTVTAVNDAPVAADDSATTVEDTNVTIEVLANDSDVDDEVLLVNVVSVTNGGALVNPDNSITYFPEENFSGEALINYTVADAAGLTANAKVTITVTAVNDPPIANNDSAITQEDVPVNINVLSNDFDAEGDTLSVTIQSVSNGTATQSAGVISFVPTLNFNGEGQVVYQLSDGNSTAQAQVTINVVAVNDNPVAQADTVTVAEDSNNTIDVLSNDSDPDGDSLTVADAWANNGVVSINSDQSLQYSPDSNFSGLDVINYTVIDGQGGAGRSSVTITVTPVNDPPIAVPDELTIDEDTVTNIAVLVNDSDPDSGDTLRIINATTSSGSVSVINIGGSDLINYVPLQNFNGQATIAYTIADTDCASAQSCTEQHSDSAVVTVTISAVNDSPVVADASAQVAENASNGDTVVGVSASDVDDTQLLYAIVSGNIDSIFGINSATGQISVTDRTFLDFERNARYVLSVSATDAQGAAGFGQVTIDVTEVAENVSLIADSAFGNTGITGLTASNGFAYDNKDTPNAAVMDSSGKTVVVGSVDNNNNDIALTRFTNDGKIDSDFGIQGVLTKDLGYFESAKAVDVDSSNNIYIAGEVFNGTSTEIFVAKVLSNGTLDSSFGSGGVVVSSMANSSLKVADVLVHANGSVAVLAGINNQFSLLKYSASGSVDSTLNIDLSGDYDTPTAMTEQADGKVLLAGYTADSTNQFNYDFAVARVDYATMTLDTGFGSEGSKVFDSGHRYDEQVYDVAVNSSGNIALVGAIAAGTNIYDAVLAVLDSSGNLSETTGSNGVKVIDADNDNGAGTGSSYATSVVFDASDHLFVGVQTGISESTQDFAVAKLDLAGQLDSGYGAAGIAVKDLKSGQNKMVRAMLDSNNQAVVATSIEGSQNQDFAIARFTATGSFDTSFAHNGYTFSNHTPSDDTLNDGIELSSSINSGKFIYTGSASGVDGISELIVARYYNAGALDTTFGNSGYFKLGNHGVSSLVGHSVVELSDGRIVVAGSEGDEALLVMLDSQGNLDTSFDSDGIKVLSRTASNIKLQIRAMARTGNDQLVFAGIAENISNDDIDIYLGKINLDGTLDDGFGSAGEVLQSLGGNEGAADMALNTDGSIVIAGRQQNNSGQDDRALIAKFTSTGALDTGFAGGNGYIAIDADTSISDNSDHLQSIALDSNGLIYAVGHSSGSNGNLSVIVSLNANGSVNSSFDGDGIKTIAASVARAITIGSNNLPVITGVKYNATDGYDDVYVTRLTAAGSIDTLFNNGSLFLINFNASDDVVVVKLLSNGGLMIAGNNQVSGYATQVWYLRAYRLVQ